MQNQDSEIVILIKKFDAPALSTFLAQNSHLPGKMANLKLAGNVQNLFYEISQAESFRNLFQLLAKLAKDDHEYVRMVAARAYGAIGKDHWKEVVPPIQALAGDDSWRVREGAAEGIGQLLCFHFDPVYQELKEWVHSGKPNLQRAAEVGMISMMSYDEPLMINKTDDILHQIESLLTVSEEYVFKNCSFAINIAGWKNPSVTLAKMGHWLKDKKIASSPTALKIFINSLDSRFGKQNAKPALFLLKEMKGKAETLSDAKDKNKVLSMIDRLSEKLSEHGR